MYIWPCISVRYNFVSHACWMCSLGLDDQVFLELRLLACILDQFQLCAMVESMRVCVTCMIYKHFLHIPLYRVYS